MVNLLSQKMYLADAHVITQHCKSKFIATAMKESNAKSLPWFEFKWFQKRWAMFRREGISQVEMFHVSASSKSCSPTPG
jgi:hypothetical protein